MPFSSGGIYTPPAAAEDAFPGKVIASADWNSIFTDISSGLTTVGQQSWTNIPTVISSPGNFTVNTTQAVIFIQATVGTITLPLSSTRSYPLKIMGAAAGYFGTHNSIVIPTSPDTLSGLGTLTLSANYQVATFYPLASGGYIVSFG
jgi:hypothetical protein